VLSWAGVDLSFAHENASIGGTGDLARFQSRRRTWARFRLAGATKQRRSSNFRARLSRLGLSSPDFQNARPTRVRAGGCDEKDEFCFCEARTRTRWGMALIDKLLGIADFGIEHTRHGCRVAFGCLLKPSPVGAGTAVPATHFVAEGPQARPPVL
jgi:hypothetical protein